MKKILTIVISVALVAAIAIGGTLAYLTSNANGIKLNNTFTTNTSGSNLAITLDEGTISVLDGKFSNNGTSRTAEQQRYPIIPGATMDKDPTIHVAADSSPCYVFSYVTNTATFLNADNIKEDVALNLDIKSSDWTAVDSVKYPGLYVYSGTQASPEKIVPSISSVTNLTVFTTFTVNGNYSQAYIKSLNDGAINVQAYAHQASGNVTYAVAEAAAIKLFFPTP